MLCSEGWRTLDSVWASQPLLHHSPTRVCGVWWLAVHQFHSSRVTLLRRFTALLGLLVSAEATLAAWPEPERQAVAAPLSYSEK